MKHHGTKKVISVAFSIVALVTAVQVSAFEPVSFPSDTAAIRLSVMGTYWGGWFSRKSPAGPVYDPQTERLFIGNVNRAALEVLDISNPYVPTQIAEVDISEYGNEPNSIDIKNGIIALLVQDLEDESVPAILFFNADGVMVADPIEMERASGLAFTPNGRKLVVTIESGNLTDNTESAIAIIDLGPANWGGCRQGPKKCQIEPTVTFASFSAYNDKRKELIKRGVRLIVPEATVAQDLQPDTLAIAPNSRKAWVTLVANNAIAEIDLQQAKVTHVFGLGLKNNSLEGNGLDASDKDGVINIQTWWPVKSFYQGDGLGLVWAGNYSYLVTANEGDPQNDEEVLARNLNLDDKLLKEGLNANTKLGRLEVTSLEGDLDGDGDYDELYAFGGRSFAVWSTKGELLFDSGDDFERITAQAIPSYFNAPEDENDFDNRSNERGPEPENLGMGTIGSQHYAFVGLERIGGIMVYDVTDPYMPHFEQYINNRNFEVRPRTVCGQNKGQPGLPTCPLAGDLEPEGILFIAKEDSPIKVPMLVVSHELSDSTTLYRIDKVK